MSDTNSTDSDSAREMSHWLSEFIYGTVAGMVAVAGLYAGHEASWLGAVSIIVVGSVTAWFAHSYSELMGHRIAMGGRSYARDMLEALRGSWPLVVAGLLLALPPLAAGLGLWSLDIALLISSLFGVVVLGLVGVLAGISERGPLPSRILLAALSCTMGLAVLGVELIVHR